MDPLAHWLAEARQLVGATLSGTHRHREIAAALDAAETALAALHAALTEAGHLITGSALWHLGTSSNPTAQPAERRQPPRDAPNQHGDCYPHESLPYSIDLPPRVIRGTQNAPIIGYIEVDGRYVGTVTAARGDTWAQDAWQRLTDLGMFAARRVHNHVEMKAVVILVQGNAKHATVVINHAPCGSRAGELPGCHTFLPGFIPRGRSLTVLGTDRNGDPFQRTYDGEASR
ncbi:hypothetical protein Acsp05_69360 [Actinokineospora sp. NBRC 105648]|nr:hypothetical protein Acsp05_69360 [Actinokineospora sp. NBRC 105648]